jgi:hypothetical protein
VVVGKDVLKVYESLCNLVGLAVLLSPLRYTSGILECLQQFLNQVSALIILRRKMSMFIGGMIPNEASQAKPVCLTQPASCASLVFAVLQ